MLILLGIFFAQFIAVFALVMNGKLLRDDRWVLAMLNSYLISITQFIFIYAVANSGEPLMVLLASSVGGSMGCGIGHLLYTRFIFKEKK
jgi:hypothetical protein